MPGEAAGAAVCRRVGAGGGPRPVPRRTPGPSPPGHALGTRRQVGEATALACGLVAVVATVVLGGGVDLEWARERERRHAQERGEALERLKRSEAEARASDGLVLRHQTVNQLKRAGSLIERGERAPALSILEALRHRSGCARFARVRLELPRLDRPPASQAIAAALRAGLWRGLLARMAARSPWPIGAATPSSWIANRGDRGRCRAGPLLSSNPRRSSLPTAGAWRDVARPRSPGLVPERGEALGPRAEARSCRDCPRNSASSANWCSARTARRWSPSRSPTATRSSPSAPGSSPTIGGASPSSNRCARDQLHADPTPGRRPAGPGSRPFRPSDVVAVTPEVGKDFAMGVWIEGPEFRLYATRAGYCHAACHVQGPEVVVLPRFDLPKPYSPAQVDEVLRKACKLTGAARARPISHEVPVASGRDSPLMDAPPRPSSRCADPPRYRIRLIDVATGTVIAECPLGDVSHHYSFGFHPEGERWSSAGFGHGAASGCLGLSVTRSAGGSLATSPRATGRRSLGPGVLARRPDARVRERR